MRGRTVVLLTMIVLAGCTAPPSGPASVVPHGPQEESPSWIAGDELSWVIDVRVSGETAQAYDGDEQQGELPAVTANVAGTMTVLGRDVSEAGEPVHLIGMDTDDFGVLETSQDGHPMPAERFGMADADGLVAVRASDLAGTPIEIEREECPQACQATGFTVLAGPEERYLDFPLQAGKSWSGHWDEPEMQDGFEGVVAWTRTVQQRVLRDTGLGEREVWPVQTSYDLPRPEALEREISRDMEQTGMDDPETTITFDAKDEVTYAPKPGHVLVTAQRFDMHAVTEGDVEGKPMRLEMHITTTTAFTVTGRTPGDGEALDRAGVLDWLNDEPDQTGTGGDPPSPAPPSYEIAVIGDGRANAAADEATVFEIALQGVDALPDGHRLTWVVLAADGAPVASGEGADGVISFRTPGGYRIVAQARDGPDLVAEDEAWVAVRHEATAVSPCGELVVEGVAGACETVAFPVGPMSTGIRVSGSSDDVEAALGALVRVEAPDGTVHEGEGEVVLEGEQTQGVWRASWAPRVGVMAQGDLHIHAAHLEPLDTGGRDDGAGLRAAALWLGSFPLDGGLLGADAPAARAMSALVNVLAGS